MRGLAYRGFYRESQEGSVVTGVRDSAPLSVGVHLGGEVKEGFWREVEV